ncbi:lipoyl(octanoyl) transferase LipB [Petrachloros mirabilis]
MTALDDNDRKAGFKLARLISLTHPISYKDGWSLQQRLHADRLSGIVQDTLLILEHLPVYTFGRRTEPAHFGKSLNILLGTGAGIEPVNRGGSITFHGPGQLVGYPIIKLTQYVSGPRAYVHLLEDVLIQTLALWQIVGYRVDKCPGIWVRTSDGHAKIASIGIRVDRGVTMHGFALNVDLDLAPFALISPCGLSDCRTITMAEILQTPVSVTLVAKQIVDIFATRFDIIWSHHGNEDVTVDHEAPVACRP